MNNLNNIVIYYYMFGTIMACLASYYFGFYTCAFYMSRFNNTPLIKDDSEFNYHYQKL